MSEQIQNAVSRILLWRIWIFDVVIVCLISGGTFFLSGTGDEDWGQMSGAAKARFWVGMMVVVGTTLRTNISKALSNLTSGNTGPPDLSGDTQTFTRQTTAQVTTEVKTIETPPKT